MWPGQCQAALGQGSDRVTAAGWSLRPGIFRSGVFMRSFYTITNVMTASLPPSPNPFPRAMALLGVSSS